MEAGKSPIKLGCRGPRPCYQKDGPHSPSQGQRISQPSEALELRGKRRPAAGWLAAQASLPDSARRAAPAAPSRGLEETDSGLIISRGRKYPQRLPRLLHRRLCTIKVQRKQAALNTKRPAAHGSEAVSENQRELQQNRRGLQVLDVWTKTHNNCNYFGEIKDEVKNIRRIMLSPRSKHGKLPSTFKKEPIKTCKNAKSVAEMKRFTGFCSISVTAEH